MRIALIQLNSTDDPAANLEAIERAVAEAMADEPGLIALPEACVLLAPEARKRQLAEPLGEGLETGGPMVRRLKMLAHRHRVHLLIGGFPERSPDPARPWNTALIINPEGAVTDRYRKIHLFDVQVPGGEALRESAATASGDTLIIAEIEGVRFGLSICYDLRFPEMYRALTRRGAHVLCVPSAFTRKTGEVHWSLLLRARAVENLAWVLAPAQWGSHSGTGRSTWGHTLAVDPWGQVAAELPEGVGHVIVDVDLETQATLRARFPALTHARPVGYFEPDRS